MTAFKPISLVVSTACKVMWGVPEYLNCVSQKPWIKNFLTSGAAERTHDLRNMALQCYLAGKTSLEKVNRVVPAESGAGVVSREQRSHARL